MPHAVLRLASGANTQETAALNENAGIAQTNLIRYFYDQNGAVLVAKLGGWSKFFPYPMSGVTRALWAWEDLNVTAHLAVGVDTSTEVGLPIFFELETADGMILLEDGVDFLILEQDTPVGTGALFVITNGTIDDITPNLTTDNIAPVVSTTSGSASVQITDMTVLGITQYNSVYIATQISIGGVVLFGLYNCDPDGFSDSDAYTVYARNILGDLLPATSSSSTPVLPSFTTVGPTGPGVSGSPIVTVNLPNYTYSLGDTFPVLVPTTVGGITFYGNYVIQGLIDANNFVIVATQAATSTATGTINGGLARFIYGYGLASVPAGEGYGVGAYGSGGYGTGQNPDIGVDIDANDWTLDNWGELLMACPDRTLSAGETPFQPIYYWQPGATAATLITNAPPVNDGIFVAMPQRQLVAWGSTETGIQDPLLISWSDVGNYNQWIPLVTNQAGNYRIPKGSRIVGAVQGPQQAIVWTDIDCWSMQYIGPPYVYSFNELGTGCGLIGRKAGAAMNGIYYWMGPSQFFTLSGNGVLPLPCSVWDVVFQNLDQTNLQKIRCAVNSLFNEIQWFYPSVTGGTGEVDSYVKYNVVLNLWDYGSLGRSAWIDQSVLGPPIGANPADFDLYQHETSNDADGAPMNSSFQTGYFALGEGDMKSFIDWIWPDFKWGKYDSAQSATVQLSFLVADYPGQTPTTYGPYSVTQATEYFYTRFRGRLVAIKVASSDLGSFWRIGAVRYRYAPDGKI
jgi:hypothetical protein